MIIGAGVLHHATLIPVRRSTPLTLMAMAAPRYWRPNVVPPEREGRD